MEAGQRIKRIVEGKKDPDGNKVFHLHGKLSRNGSSLSEFFGYLRTSYLNSLPDAGILKKQAENAGIIWPEAPVERGIFKEAMTEFGIHPFGWGTPAFHVTYRLRGVHGLDMLLSEGKITAYEAEEAKKTLERKGIGYDLSVLPINFLLPKEVITKFIPAGNYEEFRQLDSYGLFIPTTRITADVGMEGERMYICSRKFRDVVLVNIHANCPIGCAGCYKGFYTREGHKIGEDSDTVGVSLATIGVQMRELTNWLNNTPEVKAIVISGGEPLMAQNYHLKMAFDELKNAKHLSVVRICTGTIFQGMQSRIDDEFIQIIEDFRMETGKSIKFNAHIANHFQITPEALIAANRLVRNGFTIHSQLPIQEGVSFFLNDPQKSLDFLIQLGSMQNAVNVEPYKYILDMNPGSKFYPYLEPFLMVLSKFEDRPDRPTTGTGEYTGYSDLVMPRVVNILFQGGNVRLNQNILFAMEKKVDRERGRVTYYIPSQITASGAGTVFRYEEPLKEGVNDDSESLSKIRKNFRGQLKPLMEGEI